jgi:hypothetical protein
MTPEQIAEGILNAMKPAERKSWRFQIGPATVLNEIIFRSSLVTILDIVPILKCFSEFPAVSCTWQEGSDEENPPCIVFQGGIGGKVVQAVFVLTDAPE